MIGKTISHYRIESKLGEGGMGVVYKARDLTLDRYVALKFLPPHLSSDEGARKRFIVEAKAASALEHPNIAAIHEIDESSSGQTFIVMPSYEGLTLRDKAKQARLDTAEALDLVAQIASGLAKAHKKGIVHRDIKPANIFVTDDGHAKILDFGLAKLTGQSRLTRTGATVGTVLYMPPEQARGEEITAAADVFSLGVLLYELLTGRLPFYAEHEAAVLYQIMNGTPAPLAEHRDDLPEGFQSVIDKSLAKEVTGRYADATEMLRDLERLRAGGAVPAGRPGTSKAGGPAEATPSTTLWGRLMERRVPHALIVYALASFAVVQAMGWLVNRYPLSPNLPDFSLFALMSLAPTVLIVAFFHGRKAGARWSKVKGIGIPVNLVASVLILVFVFHDKDLGAATTTVTATDEAGNPIVREVPKDAFAKRLAIFYFNNETGDDVNDWLSYGFVHMLRFDIEQDGYVRYGYGWTRSLMKAGFPQGVGAPLTLRRKFANEGLYPVFLTGTISGTEENYTVRATLYRTRDVRVVASHTYRGGNLFDMADSLSIDLRRDLGIPGYHMVASPDLPVSEILTRSHPAMRLWTLGLTARTQRNDYQASVAMLDSAVTRDPSFSIAWWDLASSHSALNQGEQANAAIEAAMQHLYRLPDAVQYALKNAYHGYKKDQDAAFANTQRWVALYPYNIAAQRKLASQYAFRGQLEDAEATRLHVLDIDPSAYGEYRSIAQMYMDRGEFDKALPYLQKYQERVPEEDYSALTGLARMYKLSGQLEESRKHYKKALVMEPVNVELRNQVLDLDRRLGDFDKAIEGYKETLQLARSADDSVSVLGGIRDCYGFTGQSRLALQTYEQSRHIARRTSTPASLLRDVMWNMNIYVAAGEVDRALDIMQEMEQDHNTPQMESLVQLGYLIAYWTEDDPQNLPQYQKRLLAYQELIGGPEQAENNWIFLLIRSQILRWQGQYDQALQDIEKSLQLMPITYMYNLVFMNTHAGLICREAGFPQRGQDFLRNALVFEPYQPGTHIQMALSFDDLGQRAQAVEHLTTALRVLQDADADNRLATQARKLQADWGVELSGTP